MNLKEYKRHLSQHYVWEVDNNPEKLTQRAAHIERRYSDAFLLKVMNNTQEFNKMLLEKMAKERKISKHHLDSKKDCIYDELELPMTDDIFEYLSNGCGGGYPSDKLFHFGEVNRDTYVSQYLVKQFFGESFHVQPSAGTRKIFNGSEKSVSVFPHNTFYISGPITDFNKIVARQKNLNKLSSLNAMLKNVCKSKKDSGQTV